MTKDQRIKAIIKLAKNPNYSMADIGNKFGVSRQRINFLLKANNTKNIYVMPEKKKKALDRKRSEVMYNYWTKIRASLK